MSEPQWLDYKVLLEQHRLQIIRYGDEKGIRDQSRLDAAVT